MQPSLALRESTVAHASLDRVASGRRSARLRSAGQHRWSIQGAARFRVQQGLLNLSRKHSSCFMASATPMAEQIEQKNAKYPVMMYAKSYCMFCGQVKGLFKKLQIDYQSVNLDELHEGEEIQDELAGITGSHTVPQVFINRKYVGGCDEVMKLNSSGELKRILDEAGVASAS